MTVAFDLDGVFIDRPPFVPRSLLEWLYRGPQTNGPSYRFPTTKAEQIVRKLSHHHRLRPAFAQNIAFLHQLLSGFPHDKFYLVSSRYNFLKQPTEAVLSRYGLVSPALKVYMNECNEQPHLFKERMVKRLKIDIFIEDDPRTAYYLARCCPGVKILYYHPNGKIKSNGPIIIRQLPEVGRYLKAK